MTRITRILTLVLSLVLVLGATAAPAYAYTNIGPISTSKDPTTVEEEVAKTYDFAMNNSEANRFDDPHAAWKDFVSTGKNNNWFRATHKEKSYWTDVMTLGPVPDYTCKSTAKLGTTDFDAYCYREQYYDVCRQLFDPYATFNQGWFWEDWKDDWATDVYYDDIQITAKFGHPTYLCNLDSPLAWNSSDKHTYSKTMYKGETSADMKAKIQAWWDALDAYIANKNGTPAPAPAETPAAAPAPTATVPALTKAPTAIKAAAPAAAAKVNSTADSDKYKASDWAKETINATIDLGIYDPEAPDWWSRKDLTENCRREDFCLYVGKLFEALGKKDLIDGAVNWTDWPFINGDMEDYEVDQPQLRYICALYHLGIVNGTSATNFSPYDSLTREQAATILIRATDVLSIETPDSDIPFTDNISSWAVNGVRRAYGAKLMNGYSATEFGAKDAYTGEQALITVYRLYQAANK